MQNVELLKNKYELIRNNKDGFEFDEVNKKCTDYFESFDYIFGDFSYDKLRLKGFYDKNNKDCSVINNIEFLDIYIKDHCAYECRYFLLKKIAENEKNS